MDHGERDVIRAEIPHRRSPGHIPAPGVSVATQGSAEGLLLNVISACRCAAGALISSVEVSERTMEVLWRVGSSPGTRDVVPDRNEGEYQFHYPCDR